MLKMLQERSVMEERKENLRNTTGGRKVGERKRGGEGGKKERERGGGGVTGSLDAWCPQTQSSHHRWQLFFSHPVKQTHQLTESSWWRQMSPCVTHLHHKSLKEETVFEYRGLELLKMKRMLYERVHRRDNKMKAY